MTVVAFCGACDQLVPSCDACGRPININSPAQGCADGLHMHPDCWRRDEHAQTLASIRVEGERERAAEHARRYGWRR